MGSWMKKVCRRDVWDGKSFFEQGVLQKKATSSVETGDVIVVVTLTV